MTGQATAHPCSNNWNIDGTVNHFTAFRDKVEAENTRQANAGCVVGGWAYWLFEGDFQAFRDAYHELARALDAPYIPAGGWGGPPPLEPGPNSPANMLPLTPMLSLDMGAGSQKTLSLLGVDENDNDGKSPPVFVHPAHGMHGWLLSGAFSPLGVADAESLFTAMRHALDR